MLFIKNKASFILMKTPQKSEVIRRKMTKGIFIKVNEFVKTSGKNNKIL